MKNKSLKLSLYFVIVSIVFASPLTSLGKSFKSNVQIIEMGDYFTPLTTPKRVWIQNGKVAKASKETGKLRLKSISMGETLAKIDEQTVRLIVVPVGFKSAFEAWDSFKTQFANLKPGFCSVSVCLKGQIYSMVEFKKLVKLMQETGMSIYFGFQISEELKKELTTYIHDYFRSHNLTPLKVTFGEPWRVYSSTKDEIFQKRNLLQEVGIQWIESQQKLDLADNINVEIKIIEVKKEFARTMGIRWPTEFAAQYVDGTLGAVEDYSLRLQAYERAGDMKILASPNLLCRSGKSAEFFAGGEFPIRSESYRSSSVTWKKYGIELKIKPTIDSIGQMSVELETTISSLDKSRSVDQVPSLHTHKLMSHFDLAESKTIALSGLIKNESGTSREGLPFLSDLPVIGSLFSSRDFLENRTELVILVTPKLMKAN